MTTENWINVAMIIAVIMTAAATLVGPVLAVYVQVRMSQPKPIPDESMLTRSLHVRIQLMLQSKATRWVAFIVDLAAVLVLFWLFIRLPLSKLTIVLLVYAAVTVTVHLASLVVSVATYGLKIATFQHQSILAHALHTCQIKPPNAAFAAVLEANLKRENSPESE